MGDARMGDSSTVPLTTAALTDGSTLEDPRSLLEGRPCPATAIIGRRKQPSLLPVLAAERGRGRVKEEEDEEEPRHGMASPVRRRDWLGWLAAKFPSRSARFAPRRRGGGNASQNSAGTLLETLESKIYDPPPPSLSTHTPVNTLLR